MFRFLGLSFFKVEYIAAPWIRHGYDHHRPSKKLRDLGQHPWGCSGHIWSPTSQHQNLGTMVDENKKITVRKSFYCLVVWNMCYFPFHIWDNHMDSPSHWLIWICFKMGRSTTKQFWGQFTWIQKNSHRYVLDPLHSTGWMNNTKYTGLVFTGKN